MRIVIKKKGGKKKWRKPALHYHLRVPRLLTHIGKSEKSFSDFPALYIALHSFLQWGLSDLLSFSSFAPSSINFFSKKYNTQQKKSNSCFYHPIPYYSVKYFLDYFFLHKQIWWSLQLVDIYPPSQRLQPSASEVKAVDNITRIQLQIFQRHLARSVNNRPLHFQVLLLLVHHIIKNHQRPVHLQLLVTMIILVLVVILVAVAVKVVTTITVMHHLKEAPVATVVAAPVDPPSQSNQSLVHSLDLTWAPPYTSLSLQVIMMASQALSKMIANVPIVPVLILPTFVPVKENGYHHRRRHRYQQQQQQQQIKIHNPPKRTLILLFPSSHKSHFPWKHTHYTIK